MQCGTTQQCLTEYVIAKDFWGTEKGYYYFKTEDDKSKYYPINNTIVEEVENI
jgi:hypothetical protein